MQATSFLCASFSRGSCALLQDAAATAKCRGERFFDARSLCLPFSSKDTALPLRRTSKITSKPFPYGLDFPKDTMFRTKGKHLNQTWKSSSGHLWSFGTKQGRIVCSPKEGVVYFL